MNSVTQNMDHLSATSTQNFLSQRESEMSQYETRVPALPFCQFRLKLYNQQTKMEKVGQFQILFNLPQKG